MGPRYAQRALVPEAFDRAVHPHGARVPASLLRERLPKVHDTVTLRLARDYRADPKGPLVRTCMESITNVVVRCESYEREAGGPCLFKANY